MWGWDDLESWLKRSVPGCISTSSFRGFLASLVFPVSVLCPVAGYLILKCDTQGLVVSSPSLVHLQWFANFNPFSLDVIMHLSWDLAANYRRFSMCVVNYFFLIGSLLAALEPVCCSTSSSNCCFLTYIQVSQEAGQVVWYSQLFQNFPQFIVPHSQRLRCSQ